MSWTAVFSLHALWIPHQLAGAAGWRRVEGASVLLLSTVRSIIVYYWNFEPSIVSSINCIKCNYQISLTLDHSNAYLYIVSQWLAVHAFRKCFFHYIVPKFCCKWVWISQCRHRASFVLLLVTHLQLGHFLFQLGWHMEIFLLHVLQLLAMWYLIGRTSINTTIQVGINYWWSVLVPNTNQ